MHAREGEGKRPQLGALEYRGFGPGCAGSIPAPVDNVDNSTGKGFCMAKKELRQCHFDPKEEKRCERGGDFSPAAQSICIWCRYYHYARGKTYQEFLEWLRLNRMREVR